MRICVSNQCRCQSQAVRKLELSLVQISKNACLRICKNCHEKTRNSCLAETLVIPANAGS